MDDSKPVGERRANKKIVYVAYESSSSAKVSTKQDYKGRGLALEHFKLHYTFFIILFFVTYLPYNVVWHSVVLTMKNSTSIKKTQIDIH